MTTKRPAIKATRHAIAAGHYLAAQAGFDILNAGGNAIDAGVAAGITLAVVESEYVSFAGVAPILIYMAEQNQFVTVNGAGTWPGAASCQFFHDNHRGILPPGILRTVVPGAPAAWLAALENYGTMTFGDVASRAIRLAREGFPMYQMMTDILTEYADVLGQWPQNVAIYLPRGKPPVPGQLFRQQDLGATLQFLADEESSHHQDGRKAGLRAVRDAFYKGDIARAIVSFQRENGGLLSSDDMSGFTAQLAPPLSASFSDIDVFSCGPWCQGPMLLQELKILDGTNLKSLGHNSAAYVHIVVEAIKLAAADREAYYGDPDFVDVPLETLLSSRYAAERRALIDPDRAWPDMPPAGRIGRGEASGVISNREPPSTRKRQLDTSYVCVVDNFGNAFSATPSDGPLDAPIIPGLGFAASNRGEQSRTDPTHPASIAPGKRPRLTPNPAIAMRKGKFVMPFGSPGMDVQTQVMLQTFLNVHVFDMDPQTAVEAPRFSTHSFPSSSAPHDYQPGLLYLESEMATDLANKLLSFGHRVEPWPTSGSVHFRYIAAVCAILADGSTGVLHAAADPRRPTYALGW